VIVTPINSLYATDEISAPPGVGVRENSHIIRERESMARNILILGASYGSLLATKLLMAGHNVTLVCRRKTADLINRDGTEVRIKLMEDNNERLQAFCSVTFDDAVPELIANRCTELERGARMVDALITNSST